MPGTNKSRMLRAPVVLLKDLLLRTFETLAVPSSLKVSMQLWSAPMRCRFPRVFAKWPAGSGIAQTFSRRNQCNSRAFGTVGEV